MMAEGKWLKLTSSRQLLVMDEDAVRSKIPNLESKIQRTSGVLGNYRLVARAGIYFYGHEQADM